MRLEILVNVNIVYIGLFFVNFNGCFLIFLYLCNVICNLLVLKFSMWDKVNLYGV